MNERYFAILLICGWVIFIIGSGIVFYSFYLSEDYFECSEFSSCLENRPFYCNDAGKVVMNSGVCNCLENFLIKGNSCESNYETEEKVIRLNYFLNEKESFIYLDVFKGVSDYVAGLPRELIYFGDQKPLRVDFNLNAMNNEVQNFYLMDLVFKIREITEKKEDQLRIAVSLVQNIPYENANRSWSFKGTNVEAMRFPYEVLYEGSGVCEEKSNLLAYLLREFGYSVVIFHFPSANHQAVGVACPIKKSFGGTGYCFIETTGPAIISSSNYFYADGIVLGSDFQILKISEGDSLGWRMREYRDGKRLDKINQKFKDGITIGALDMFFLNRLKERYSLD